MEAMRAVFDRVPFDGSVAIGEGERDDAPMLWIGEPLDHFRRSIGTILSILQSTHWSAQITSLRTYQTRWQFSQPVHEDPYCTPQIATWDKIAGPAEIIGEVSLEADTAYNVEAASSALGKLPEQMNIVVMDRPRHENLISELKHLGVNPLLIGDGDVAAALNAADPESEIDMLMGIGAAPEGVITATALRGLGAQFEGRLVFRNDGHRERAEKMVDGDIERIWLRDDLCQSDDSVFIGTGVCDGRTNGVQEIGDGSYKVQSEVIEVHSKSHRIVEKIILQ